MTEQTQVTVQPKADAPAEWGSRDDITALANRLKTMLPGTLDAQEALLLAQYSTAMDANPFRGEIYAYKSRGKLVLTEGYKLLVRWARNQCQFYERYERITNDTDTIPDGAIAFRCRILRQDAVADLAALTQAGVPNAYEICSTEAIGVVTTEDTWSKKYNKPVDPPKGWTWEDVARKRALKNALNRAYGAPSPREIAAETWRIEDTLTIPEDWQGTDGMIKIEAEANALYNANRRLSQPSTLSAVESMADLGFPTDVTEEIIEQPQKPPEPELEQETGKAPSEAVETPQEATGNAQASPWHKRSQLINDALENISYYGHGKHILNTLTQLEREGVITWASDDDSCLKLLEDTAKARADEKAAAS